MRKLKLTDTFAVSVLRRAVGIAHQKHSCGIQKTTSTRNIEIRKIKFACCREKSPNSKKKLLHPEE